jgi:DNA-directed RNA polymerase subunit N (RpoN/RPB10)
VSIECFSCGESIRITNVAEYHDHFKKLIQAPTNIKISAADINEIDTPGLQLFSAVQKTLKQKGFTILWEDSSENLIAAANQLGLSDHLGLPQQFNTGIE